ncbi:hypothetical protein TNCV_1908381 [Trichonephila clavipes]|nr:hypothetical protein TNCV_1908381 [Trichonephila clavipes]
MVLKANDRRTSCPCHDEFRGPRSDYVRQVALATTTQQQRFLDPVDVLCLLGLGVAILQQDKARYSGNIRRINLRRSSQLKWCSDTIISVQNISMFKGYSQAQARPIQQPNERFPIYKLHGFCLIAKSEESICVMFRSRYFEPWSVTWTTPFSTNSQKNPYGRKLAKSRRLIVHQK